MSIIEFLRARLAEDEAVARAAIVPEHTGEYHPHPPFAEWVYHPGGEVEYANSSHDVPLHGGRMGTSGPAYVTMDHEGLLPSVEDDVGPHIARHDPARVLREVESKRRIVDWECRYRTTVEKRGEDWAHRATGPLRALASVYADHPDYRDEWSNL